MPSSNQTTQVRQLVQQAQDALAAYHIAPSPQTAEVMREVIGKCLDTLIPPGDPVVQELFNKLRQQCLDDQLTPETMSSFLFGVLLLGR